MKTYKRVSLSILLVLAVLNCALVPAQAQENNELFAYVLKSDAKMLDEMLSNGSDVNHVNKINNNSLIMAAKIGDKQVLETLLKHNADPNMQNDAGATALMIAAKYGHEHVVDMLLAHGASPLIQTNKGYKASTFAYGYKHHDLHEKLADAEQIAAKKAKEESKKAKIAEKGS